MAMILLLVLLALALLLAWVRFAPSEPGRWHVDPLEAQSPGEGGWLVRPEGGQAVAPVWPVTPGDLLERLDAVAMETPRTERLAGGPGSGRITYVTRSRLFGFPDYTTVAALPADGGATLAILARLRFGRGDMGVNRARVEGWLAELDRRIAAEA